MSNTDERDVRYLQRIKKAALFVRESTINRIKSIHEMSVRVVESPELLPDFLISVKDLDPLWETFLANNQAVLEALSDLDLLDEFSLNLETDTRALCIRALATADKYKPTLPRQSLSNINDDGNESVISNKSGINSGMRSRLPEIPLPSYSGSFSDWPVFRDRFKALIAQRTDLSNIERFYYLLGCLKGEALNSIRNIVVSETTYELAWSTLVDRFDRPRQLATLIVDKLISIPAQSQESLEGLKDFLVLFSDQTAVLESLQIPNLGEFLLFALSSRCLPLSTRKGFEAVNSEEFPAASDVIKYVKGRVSILEAVRFSGSSRRLTVQRDNMKPSTFRNIDKRPKFALVAAKSSGAPIYNCVFCNGSHGPSKCRMFQSASVEDRNTMVREKKICFSCLSSSHWSNRCKERRPCKHCPRMHHSLLHVDKSDGETLSNVVGVPVSNTSVMSTRPRHTVLLGTALAHIKDRAGIFQTVRVLIDSASQISAVTSSCVNRLGLSKRKWTALILGLAGAKVPLVEGVVDCRLTPRYAPSCRLSNHSPVCSTTRITCKCLGIT
ncbi:uncharacterized protein LOC126895495 [Daktulosphaira vitifoliae]|uniref:uncharacterized protein LOC126895495 n=1 Tax=Daktulosphaira vitifoliae TaxID=58002 RepID=UPI0021AA1039|nr:uncharacterized protein LOC126895495 [Daktulosphaira vitifoliae]